MFTNVARLTRDGHYVSVSIFELVVLDLGGMVFRFKDVTQCMLLLLFSNYRVTLFGTRIVKNSLQSIEHGLRFSAKSDAIQYWAI